MKCSTLLHNAHEANRIFSIKRRYLSLYKELKANKSGLSYELDVTMRDGHHNMNLFVAGFVRAVSSKYDKAHNLESLRKPYQAMENSFDCIDPDTRAFTFWSKIGKFVRKGDDLAADVESLGGFNESTPASDQYVIAINQAAENMYEGDPRSKGDLLLAHAYVRYLADAFGGSMLGKPTKLALDLPEVPRFYRMPEAVRADRRRFIESFYEALNEAGSAMDQDRRMQLVEEAKRAYKLNALIVTERPNLFLGAVRGTAKLTWGLLRDKLSPQRHNL